MEQSETYITNKEKAYEPRGVGWEITSITKGKQTIRVLFPSHEGQQKSSTKAR